MTGSSRSSLATVTWSVRRARVPIACSGAWGRTPDHGGRATALVAVVGIVLAGCTASPEPAPTPSVTGDPEIEGERGWSVEDVYAQEIVWESGIGSQLATITAPLDWDHPEAGTIQLMLSRYRATGSDDQRIGSLLINPGGPGASGVEYAGYFANGVVGDELRTAYDIVGFDPRGVGLSSAVDCGEDAAIDEFLTADVLMDDQADLDASQARLEAFGAACLESTGPLLGEVDTVSAARDLDLMRAVLGDDHLHYLGYSYGTLLGATYADLFPENVGRMVLDSAVDPAATDDDLTIDRSASFERALRNYVADCQAGADCPLTGDVDAGLAQLVQIVLAAQNDPIPAGAAEVNGGLAVQGVGYALYDDATWPYLTQALAEVLTSGTATVLLGLANAAMDRTDDGTYASNRKEAQTAVMCLDRPTVERDLAERLAFQEQVAVRAPSVAAVSALLGSGCAGWPIAATGEPREITAPGAAPILVVGVTEDPATPYEWSVALADQLESGVLLTWQGEGHTAYGRAGECVSTAVESYLLTGVAPEDGTTC